LLCGGVQPASAGAAAVAEALLEAIDATAAVDDLLLAGEEGVALEQTSMLKSSPRVERVSILLPQLQVAVTAS
jgi:hypothetical protein